MTPHHIIFIYTVNMNEIVLKTLCLYVLAKWKKLISICKGAEFFGFSKSGYVGCVQNCAMHTRTDVPAHTQKPSFTLITIRTSIYLSCSIYMHSRTLFSFVSSDLSYCRTMKCFYVTDKKYSCMSASKISNTANMWK